MLRLFAALGLAVLSALPMAGAVQAEGCPPSYRFVDFGVEGRDGVLRRGGTIFRAFAADGARLLEAAATLCRAVPEVSTDGRALPIPVVARVAVRPEVAGLPVTGLRLSVVDDAVAEAEANAAAHRAAVARAGAVPVRGADFLCLGDAAAASCQIVSPYGAEAALVVYCDAARCEMPVLARDARLVIAADWPRTAGTPEALGAEVSGRIAAIYAFLEEQI